MLVAGTCAENGVTYDTVMIEAKKVAKELLTACRELAKDESTVSTS
jgi:hypothetical protein